MFHRVSQQAAEASKSQENQESKAPDTSGQSGQQQEAPKSQNPAGERPSREPMNNTTANQQRKDTQVMNADSPDNKSQGAQGAYQPTPAQAPSRMDIPGARPVSSPAVARGSAPSYPGSPSGSSSYSPTPAAANERGNVDKKLQIGPGITLSGEIEDCEYLYVEGTVEAALKGASVLEIAESGAFYGTVEIDEARIAGRFEGDLTVKGRLTIEASGSITGTIAYKELAVEVGATLDGKLTPIDAKGEARVTEGNFGRGKARKEANASRAENELPFSDKAAVNAAE